MLSVDEEEKCRATDGSRSSRRAGARAWVKAVRGGRRSGSAGPFVPSGDGVTSGSGCDGKAVRTATEPAMGIDPDYDREERKSRRVEDRRKKVQAFNGGRGEIVVVVRRWPMSERVMAGRP